MLLVVPHTSLSRGARLKLFSRTADDVFDDDPKSILFHLQQAPVTKKAGQQTDQMKKSLNQDEGAGVDISCS